MKTTIEFFSESGNSPPRVGEERAARDPIPGLATRHSDAVTHLPDHLLTVKEAAAYARVCEETVRRAYHAGQLSALRIGRTRRIRPGDLQDWLEREGKTRAA